MKAAESLLISISGHFQEFHSGFDFELPISFESGNKTGLIFEKYWNGFAFPILSDVS